MAITILLVEDEFLLREMAREDLEDLGHVAHCAEDYDKAIAALNGDAAFDVLITDIRIPGVADGWELARVARARRPDLGVIYISGYSSDLPQLVEGGIFLKKPYRLAEMEQALMQVGRG